ncbi:MAG: diguanylate cyclase [Gammaproteobacteria bacterium BRH_c0]|nr:MAG: diguanylate cyclase [Gammaproteobacteria bacterium BRH_c0]
MAHPVFDRKKRFVVILAVLLGVGFLATTLISYYVARDSLARHISDEMLPLTSDNIYSEIQRDLLRPILISSLMANDTFVRDWALNGEQDSELISNYLGEIQKKYGTITAFYISDKTLNYYHPDGIIKVLDSDDPEDGWYFPLRNYPADYDINVDDDTVDRSRLSIFINYRVKDYAGRFIGVTGVGLSVNSVVALIESYQRRYGRQIYFVNRDGEIMLHGKDYDLGPRLRDRPGLAPFATQILTAPSTTLTYQRDGERAEIYLNSRLVPEFDWYLMVEQKNDSGKERIDQTLLVNILLALLVTVAVLLVANFTLRGYQQRLIDMATTDKLTGAASRHGFDSIFEHDVKLAKRRQQPLSLLAIDLDHFKSINDSYGHQGGDTVIQVVAARIREQIRDSDTLCRWGGEEFLVLLENCALDAALQRAERIRQIISAKTVRFGRDEIDVTMSIGVAQYYPGEGLDALINRADGALYAAKGDGRNRVKSA